MKRNILLSSVTALAIISLNANAAQVEKLDEVNVWETEIVSSSVNLGKDAIETKQADHLSDLLRDIPGVDVGGTHSINNRINIRGLQDENLDITIDGAKVQNANMFHHIGNLLINPDILKKAKIQVGTNSVVNGSLGGSVEFETKDGRDMLEEGQKVGGRVSTTINSNDSIGGSISAFAKPSENIDVLIYHNQVNKDNWEDGAGAKTFGVDGNITNTLFKVGADLSSTQRVIFSYDKFEDKGNYVPRPNFSSSYNKAATGDTTYDTDYDRDTITLRHELDLGEEFLLNSTLYSNTNNLSRYEKNLNGTPVRPPFGIPAGTNFEGLLDGEVKTVGLNLKAQSTLEIGSILNTFTYGALYDKQTSKVTWRGAKYGDNEEAKSAAIYVENMMEFENGLLVTPGIRFNKYDFDGAYGKIDDDKFTYGLASEYPVTNDLTLLASATTLYKGVEMVDVLASNRAAVPDNTNLKSETGINKEVGFRYIKDDVLGADNIGFSFKLFKTTIKDYIKQEYNKMSNMGKLELDGFESSFAYNKGNLNSLLTYSHSESNFEQTGESTVEQPGDSLSLKLDYKINKELNLTWESLYAFEEKDVPTGYDVKQSYNVHDLAFNFKPANTKGLTIIAGIDNIFDKEYVAHSSDNRTTGAGSTADYEPGRSMKVTLAYKF